MPSKSLVKRREACRNHYKWNKKFYRQRNIEHKLLLLAYIKKAKNKPCADCGKKFPYYVLDFDHVKGKKSFNISSAVNMGVSLERLLEEIKKTEIVCSNCHRERTFNPKKETKCISD
jgi:hypothetical protein